MAKLSDFKDRKEFMAYVRSMKNKNKSMSNMNDMEMKNMKKNKKSGKGLLGDLLNEGKNYAMNKGEELLKEKGKELVDKAINMAVKKVRGGKMKGKGLLSDISKSVFKTGMNVIPMPGIVRDIGSNVGELLIDKIGGGLNDTKKNLLVSKDKTILINKNMAQKGGALKIMGLTKGSALKVM